LAWHLACHCLIAVHVTLYTVLVGKLTLLNDSSVHEFDLARVPYGGHGLPMSVLDLSLQVGIELNHDCGGSCSCTTCHVEIVSGEENCSPMEEDESDLVATVEGATSKYRLGCQCIVKGDIVFRIPV